MEQILYEYWLFGIRGIGRVKRGKLLERFQDAAGVFHAAKSQLERTEGICDRDVLQILEGREKQQVRRRWEEMRRRGICFVSINSEQYPQRLRTIYDPPYGLFYRGKLPDEDKPAVAVVGARNASNTGMAVAERFGRELAENGVQVISGLARGIDISSQRGVLSIAGGQTFGVMGCGIDICYPRQHIHEFMMAQESGGILSEYALGMPPFQGNFPQRNRIISGLSDGVLVVEARQHSGSLITAELGLEQGRDIFAVPGAVDNPLCEGCNRLIQSGAALVTQVADILDAMGLFYDTNLTQKKKKNKVMLETTEKIVYASLSLEPAHISQIAARVQMAVPDVMDILVSLEIRRLAEMVGNNYYALRL